MQRLVAWSYYLVPMLVIVIGFVVVAREPRLVSGLRSAVFDTYQRLQPREYTPLNIKVIDVDDESLRRLGQWPWPRNLLARLVDRLRGAGVAVIGMDLIFSEPDRTSPAEAVAAWPDGELTRMLLARRDELPDHDALFASSLAQTRAVGGYVFTGDDAGVPPQPLWALEGDDRRALALVPEFVGVVPYLPQLQASLAGAGSFNLVSDEDGISRRLHLFYALDGVLYPSFAAELLRVAQRATGYQVSMAPEGVIESVKIGELRVPTDGEGRAWLYFTRDEPQRIVSAWRILDPGFDLSSLADHVVVLGSSAAGLKDLRATPLNRATAGVLLHVNLVEQVLTGEFLLRPAWAEPAEFVYALVLALVLLLVLRRLGAIGSAALGAVVVLSASGFSWFAFSTWGWLVDPVLPSLVALAVYLVATTVNFLRVEGERRLIRHAFGHYLAPQVVQELSANPGMLKLGGEKRETTFVFTDVAGFTTTTETLDPESLVQMLNDYLDGACQIVLDHGGTIDKIVGDALHVMFNAPGEQPDHPLRAMRCALELDAFCQRFVAQQRQQGLTIGSTRIGVNTGPTVVGNFGGAARFDYTAHGDAINTAARLESANKYLGTRVCVSATTRDRCADIPFRPVGDLILKGKTEPLRVYEPVPGRDEEQVRAYTAAFRAMEQVAPEALAMFEALQTRYPDDPLAAFHARRLSAGHGGVLIVMEKK